MKINYIQVLIIMLIFPIFTSAQIPGCTDPLASNYNVNATANDGSCVYGSASITPIASFNLGTNFIETSGLINWNEKLWTHNDNSDTNIYSLDTLNGNLLQAYPLSNVVNIDWEEISQDSNFVYIGDFGNNVNGNRTDLKILRIAKNSILANSPIIDTISFSYSDQVDFSPTGSNNTDFDCEAFIVSNDSIYLFTKQWVSKKTTLYSLPKTPGNYSANWRATLDIQGLITGATYLESKRLISLCGYSIYLQPFIYLLYDFENFNYFIGNKRKLNLSLGFHQVEGICTTDGLKYYISNESFIQPPIINNPQKLHILDLSSFLSNYFNSLVTPVEDLIVNNMTVFPNPVTDFVFVNNDRLNLNSKYTISNYLGKIALSGVIDDEKCRINLTDLAPGVYMLKISGDVEKVYRLVKQ